MNGQIMINIVCNFTLAFFIASSNPFLFLSPYAIPASAVRADLAYQPPNYDPNWDENNYNGYWWYEQWVPGMVSYDTQFMRLPPVSMGNAVFYAPEVMQANVEYRGLSMDGMVGAVSAEFCSEIGHKVWLQRPGEPWEGPFIVADCSRRNDLYGHIVYFDQVVEVDFDTAVRWGLARYGGSENEGRWSTLHARMSGVLLSTIDPSQFDGNIIDLDYYFMDNVTFAKRSESRGYIQNYRPPSADEPYPQWLLGGIWTVFP